MKYLSNAISLGMLDELKVKGTILSVECRQIDLEEATDRIDEWADKNASGFMSIVGHADTALLLSGLLGREIEMNRSSTSVVAGDELLVAQYNGARLPEGATSLPEGSTIRWIHCKIHRMQG